jgi:V/A-type H+-transporting ATPase subunit K
VTKRIRGSVVLLAITSVLSLLATLLFWWQPAMAVEGGTATGQTLAPDSVSWGFVAAALATGLSSLGAGIAVAGVGSAAIGAIAEKPEMLGRSLIIVGLAEGIAIYGLIISILILNRVL